MANRDETERMHEHIHVSLLDIPTRTCVHLVESRDPRSREPPNLLDCIRKLEARGVHSIDDEELGVSMSCRSNHNDQDTVLLFMLFTLVGVDKHELADALWPTIMMEPKALIGRKDLFNFFPRHQMPLGY